MSIFGKVFFAIASGYEFVRDFICFSTMKEDLDAIEEYVRKDTTDDRWIHFLDAMQEIYEEYGMHGFCLAVQHFDHVGIRALFLQEEKVQTYHFSFHQGFKREMDDWCMSNTSNERIDEPDAVLKQYDV